MDQRHRRSNAASRGSLVSVVPIWLALGLCTTFAVLRAWDVDTSSSEYTLCQGCFFLPTLGHDAWVLSALAALLGGAVLVRPRWLRMLLRVVAAIVLLAMGLDTALSLLLAQRLLLTDVLKFVGDMGNNWSVASDGLFTSAGLPRLLLGLGCVATALTLCLPGVRKSGHGIALLLIAFGWAGFAALSSGGLNYVHKEKLRNLVENNLQSDRLVDFSAAFVASARERSKSLPTTCESRPAHKPDVIFLLVESLSSYQSKLLGGPESWTPGLDALAREHHYLSHFHASGFTTIGGEIALLTGRPPFYPPGLLNASFDYFKPSGEGLVDVAHRNGYTVSFFTSADTTFLDIGARLQRLGIDKIDGSEAIFYQGMKRYTFGAAEDKALFDRYLQWLDQGGSGDHGNISVLVTVSGHPPFVDPVTGIPSEERTFRYVDAQIVRFQRELAQRGFFDHGVLLILGDHRSMTPLRPGELRQFGERAFSRVPLIVVGDVVMPKVVDAPFQQTDLLPSLRDFFGERVCTNPFQGRLLRPEPIPPEYTVHVRGDDRNRIDVYGAGGALWGYHTNGDASHWIGEAPADAQRIADWITVQRTDTGWSEN